MFYKSLKKEILKQVQDDGEKIRMPVKQNRKTIELGLPTRCKYTGLWVEILKQVQDDGEEIQDDGEKSQDGDLAGFANSLQVHRFMGRDPETSSG